MPTVYHAKLKADPQEKMIPDPGGKKYCLWCYEISQDDGKDPPGESDSNFTGDVGIDISADVVIYTGQDGDDFKKDANVKGIKHDHVTKGGKKLDPKKVQKKGEAKKGKETPDRQVVYKSVTDAEKKKFEICFYTDAPCRKGDADISIEYLDSSGVWKARPFESGPKAGTRPNTRKLQGPVAAVIEKTTETADAVALLARYSGIREAVFFATALELLSAQRGSTVTGEEPEVDSADEEDEEDGTDPGEGNLPASNQA